MGIFWSASAGGFFDTDFANYTLPQDAVEITAEAHVGLLEAQYTGHSIALVNGVPAPLPPAPPTLAQQAAAMLAAGCAITSTGTPAIDGTYAVDAESRADVQAELLSILVNSAFTNGTTTLVWPGATAGPYAFTTTQFKALATALGAFVGTLKPIVSSGAGALPAQPVVIA